MEAVVTTYNAKIPKGLYQNKVCPNKQDTVNFQYVALYNIKDIKKQKDIAKENGRSRIKHYYQLTADFDLEDCLQNEKIEIRKKYNIDTLRDSTDLLYEQKKINNEIKDIEIKTYQR